MNICTIFYTNQNQSWLDFSEEIWPKFSYTNTCNKIHFICFEGE